MTAKIAAMTYSFGTQADEDLDGVLRGLRNIGYLGVELFGLHGHSISEVRAMLDEHDLALTSCHVDFPVGPTASKVLSAQQKLGTEVLVWSLEKFEFATLEGIQRGVERVNEAAENAEEFGLRIAVHNHEAEFLNEFEGRPAYEHLQELLDPRVGLEFDMYWAALGGADPAAVIGSLGDRVKHTHVKDGPITAYEDVMEPLGAGKMDLSGTLAANDSLEWHIVELDRTAMSMMRAMQISYDYLSAQGLTEC